MKLVVQIPCLNEEQTLPSVLETIPRKIAGIDQIVIVIVDDGSTDNTVDIAKQHGVKHFVRHKKNMGLAQSFHDGVNYALSIGADIVVNTDGDNQYPQERIADLVQPILNGEAEIVIGDRQTHTIEHFSPLKKFFQKIGSGVVNKAAGTNLPDAASGFRAYSREALYRINIVTSFSYCMETIIQAGNKRIPITSVKIKTNPKTRESRLFKNMWQHMFKSGSAIIRSYLMYRPYVLFLSLACLFGVLGLIPFIRYLLFIFSSEAGNHLQSLLLGAVLLTGSFLCVALGVIADLVRINRIINEQQLELARRVAFSK